MGERGLWHYTLPGNYYGSIFITLCYFRFLKDITLLIKEQSEGFQTVLALKGVLRHGINGQKIHTINEGQFTVLDRGRTETQTIVPGGKECQVLNTYYPAKSYADLLPLFPALKRDLKKANRKPRFFLSIPRPARHSILDATHEILFETYRPQLQQYY